MAGDNQMDPEDLEAPVGADTQRHAGGDPGTLLHAAGDAQPQAGLVERFYAPGGPGVRMDSHLYAGYDVPPFYDSLLGKLVVWGHDRPAAIARSKAALDELVVDGVVTNRSFHRALLENAAFVEGRVTTNLIDRVGTAAFLASERG